MILIPAKYRAKINVPEVRWRLANPSPVVIGPEPRLVLAVRARRDVEMLVSLTEFPTVLVDGGIAEAVLVQVPHVVGLRRLKPEGEPWACGQENVLASAMFGGKPEDAASAPDQVRWWGGTVKCLEYIAVASPHNYWSWRGRVSVPKGLSLGVIVRCSVPTTCRVKMSGV